MMTFQQKTKEVPGLLYVAESMEFMSSAGRRRMMEQPLLTDAAAIDASQEDVQAFRSVLGNEEYALATNKLRHQLMQLHDLQTSLSSLRSHVVLEEVELFEIKVFAHLCGHARQALEAMSLAGRFPLPDLQEVFRLLDPDGTGIPTFYVYDSYDIRLAPLRRRMKEADEVEMASLLVEQNEIQLQVVTRLCDRLHSYADALSSALEQMAYIDFTLARAVLAEAWQLVPPVHDGGRRSLRQLVNPRLKQHNEAVGLRYQPVDIDLVEGVTLVTGANMAGKTVLLKSVGTAQLMYQFGFPIPCYQAVMEPVDDVVFCIGDEQNEMNGLSSFASEITRISDVVRRSRKERLLVLIDEPARTTNPVEGKALVQAIVTLLQESRCLTLVTTHYSQLGVPCRRLRVKGFVEDLVDIPLTAQNINRFIDYSLVADDSDEAPQEALRIAEMLTCDTELVATARQFL
ncbi:MAG: DNA mismatch repair protein MutS [Bacteroidales bacterium]|nr:DNA mismatch repair protein MutS [Bacteroidales bacterium]